MNRLLRIALSCALFCAAAASARALSLGETKAQLLARHGAPGAEDHARNLAMYFWDGWSAQLEFQGETVCKITYRRNWYLQDQEITSLLEANGGAAHWRETSDPAAKDRLWARDDGAAATCLRERPLTIVFETALVFADSAAGPKVVAPTTPYPASAKAPSFPRQLGAVPEPDLPAADVPAPARAPGAAPHALPRLPAAEIPAQEPEPSTSPAQATIEPQALPAQAKPAPPQQPVSVAATSSHGPACTLGALALLAVAGTGFYLRKRGFHPATLRPAAARRTDPALAFPRALPDLGSLRWDQFELLVGEIFRRQGYSVELSAAMGSEDGIDLTLRRDSETILVQCKHWKTAQVSEGEIQEFYRAIAASGAPRGIFVTTGEFTPVAREFAGGKGIEMMDGAALAKSIAALARPGENLCVVSEWIEEFVANARIFDPECPICHGTMAVRHSRANGAPSWNCRNYPRCPGRRDPRLDLLPAPAERT